MLLTLDVGVEPTFDVGPALGPLVLDVVFVPDVADVVPDVDDVPGDEVVPDADGLPDEEDVDELPDDEVLSVSA